MKKILLTIAILSITTTAMAISGLDRADNKCRSEVRYYVEHSLGGGSVGFPPERFSSENANAYFVHYKKDLAAHAQLKNGAFIPLDIRCTIAKKTFETLMVNVNGVTAAVAN